MSQSFSNFQPLAAIATTPTGAAKLQLLCQLSGATLWVPETLTRVEAAQPYSGSLKDHLAKLWPDHKGFIFCLATGAVVRLIAPLLTHKSSDPAVVVIDEANRFVISLCSGHQGGADRLTQLLANQIGATPIVTGAANAAGLTGIDLLGLPFSWQRGAGDWNRVSGVVARCEPVRVIQTAGSTLWQDNLSLVHPFHFQTPERHASSSPCSPSVPPKAGEEEKSLVPSRIGEIGGLVHQSCPYKATIWISPCEHPMQSDLPAVQWHPRVLWVGIGCERGTSRQLIELAVHQTFQAHHLAIAAIAGIATLDLKADEVGLLELCQAYNWPLRCFSATVLQSVSVPNPSAVVAAEVGTPSVAEAAALQAASGNILSTSEGDSLKETLRDPPIELLHEHNPSLLITKQIVRSAPEPGAVTIAVAEAEQEFIGRTGQLLLVGTGPGQLDQMTPAAQAAVSQADGVIGYSLYVDLLQPLFRPGQIIERLPITQERQRAERAIALARWGLTLAVVSSGDCGIYGMAGLVLEELQAQGWDGKTPGIQVFPGVTALQAAASRVGAPLMHDFCAISLSTLLTPWEIIEKRLEAAAQADFVTTLYNPRSQTRTEQILKAQQIFLRYRKPDTPVAIVRSAYRPDEQVTLTTLDELQNVPIDMLTTVLIGNQSTRFYADWMITPRGYLGF